MQEKRQKPLTTELIQMTFKGLDWMKFGPGTTWYAFLVFKTKEACQIALNLIVPFRMLTKYCF